MNIRPPFIDHYEWQDSVADWAVSHQKLTEAELDRFIADRDPIPPVPADAPAEACTEMGANQLAERVRSDDAAFRRLLRRLGLLAIVAGSLGCAIYQVSGHA